MVNHRLLSFFHPKECKKSIPKKHGARRVLLKCTVCISPMLTPIGSVGRA